ncbi:TetR family transcriptional regulator [Agrobacterium vitis]|uniref:TetR family transcriptional regulator n=1 Tax=Agrobacterium vitis TaxID=373 RepID=UPI0018D206D0|nr:TetR family transcriptional regulator [Agrobacterium vitis]
MKQTDVEGASAPVESIEHDGKTPRRQNTKVKGHKSRVAPRKHAPELRRQEILASALMEFASKGFGGARTESIVARTNTNTAMLFHYFGSKENLYIAVLESIYDDIRKKEAEIDFETMTPVAAIEALVSFTFNYYIEQPHFVRMINNENQHEIAFLKKSEKIARANTSIIEALQKIVDRGVEHGEFRDGIDVTDLYISISALGFTYVSNRHTLGLVFGRDLFTREAIDSRLSTMTEMILRYLQKS